MEVVTVVEEYEPFVAAIKKCRPVSSRRELRVFGKTITSLCLSAFSFLLFCFTLHNGLSIAYSQTVNQPNTFTQNQSYGNYLANSAAFRQEVARMEIYVLRRGESLPLSITEVPRLEKNDTLKVRLLDEPVNGVKPDQSNYDWTFLIAYVNPGRNSDRENTVSEEIQFKKRGWYREYSFTVPYDSQAIFFLYPKSSYRAKILNLISNNQDEIRKLGEKTIEIAGVYAKIGSFLNELQAVVNRNQYYNGIYASGSVTGYGYYANNYNDSTKNFFMQQAVERLARSFNIQLPSCWTDAYGYNYNVYNNNSYNAYNNNYGVYNRYGSYGMGNDFTGRVQCVAKNVRLEDLDMSVSRMLQQGGILAAAELTRKYPQIAFWINIAAAALDFILKFTRKAPLRIIPTVFSTNQNSWQNYSSQAQSYQTSFAPVPTKNFSAYSASGGTSFEPVKISLYAESPPNDNGFVTAYPLVIHKWQANPDPEIISLPTPTLMEPCLHAGQNIIRSTDLLNDWMTDPFTKDFKLVVSSPSGFRKEFPLRKNIGLGGWELELTEADLNSYPNINLNLESEITGKRGFNTVRTPKFELPLPITGSWFVKPESQETFVAGGKRTVALRNQTGNCRCLQAVVYKPSFGGEFVFEPDSKENPLKFSAGNKEVSFEVDATNFQPGQGKLELMQYGGKKADLTLNLYPAATVVAASPVTGLNLATPGNNKVDGNNENLKNPKETKTKKTVGENRKKGS